ncbi:SURF1 family protein [Dietzia sp. UBA5065]|uniref:SURF1 family cytochrome oxidase biogenesis protein n=1 Tax=Dietzia sp. UBA5065 TaxID=1946422 RepID=UPI0025C0D5E0|nr:SURF1 family cytochrome oxidase biogenesis protein [Dietzia sp. UBA5065]HMT50083.1 SURF1 family cytochrome oxidase biogenesis protein [Dietzia sp.]
MRTLRRFISPGWVIGLLGVILFAWACFALLAPWQLGKSDDLDARNARLAESVQADPAPLAQVVDDPGGYVDREWRLVTLEGRWQPDAEALLRLRSVDGEPVYQVLTVFDPDEGGDILVNRGVVPVGENNTVPAFPAAPGGEVGITARVRATEAGQAEPVVVDGFPAVRVVDPVVIGGTLGHDLVPQGYLQLVGGQPGSLTPAPIPGIESGPYLSYGLQWLAFGILAPLALGYFAWAEIRARRRDAERDEPRASGTPDGSPAPDSRHDVPAGNPASPADVEVDARARAMRARYGDRDDAEHRRAFKRADRLRG